MPSSEKTMTNIFSLPTVPLCEELQTALFSDANIHIERIISYGQTSDWYDQEQNEFVMLLEGSAQLEYEDGEILTLNKGDSIFIASHKKHRVAFTSSTPPCIWLCIFWT